MNDSEKGFLHRPTIFSLSALLAAGSATASCAPEEAEETGPAYETVAAEHGTLRIIAEATGEVEPIRRVEVKSKASGEVLRLLVDVGDNVEPGALLAEIDPRDVQNAFNQAQADLGVAEARMQNSEAERDRSIRLLEAGVITPQENEATHLDYANAQANLVKAETNLELAELRLNDVRIRAPMAGTILEKNVEEGSVIQSASGNVSGGTTLFVMANLEEMQVRTRVDESDMGELSPSLTTSVIVEAYPDITFPGRLDKIEPQAEVVQNVTMFPVIIALPNSTGLLKPGMNAEVEIFIDEARDVLLVPNGAIVQTADVGPAALALGLDIDALDLGSFMRAGFAGGGGGGGAGFGPGGGGLAAGAGAGMAFREGRTPGARGGGSGPGAAAGALAEDGPAEAAGGRGGARANVGPRGTEPLRAADLAAQALGTVPADGAVGGDGEVAASDQPASAPPASGMSLGEIRSSFESGAINQDSMRALLMGLRSQAGAGGGFGAGMGMPGANAWTAGAQERESRPAVVFVLGEDGLPSPRMIQIGLNDWDRTEVVTGLEIGDTLVVVGAAQLRARQEEWMNQMRNRFGGGGSPLPTRSSGRGPR